MSNFTFRIDLLRLKGAFVTNIKGKTAVKRCLCIAIDDSPLFLGKKGCYINITAHQVEDPKYGDTHCLRVSYDKEQYEAMTDDERKALPIIGNMRPLERKPESMSVDAFAQACEDSDLPF